MLAVLEATNSPPQATNTCTVWTKLHLIFGISHGRVLLGHRETRVTREIEDWLELMELLDRTEPEEHLYALS